MPFAKDTLERVKPIIIENNGRLDVEERTSLACAYKQILNGLRTQLNPTSPQQTAQTGDKSSAVTVEINRVCNEVLDLLRRWLLPAAAVGEESVFYWKMLVAPRLYLYTVHRPGEKTGLLTFTDTSVTHPVKDLQRITPALQSKHTHLPSCTPRSF